MSDVEHVTNDAALPVLVPADSSVSADPIEGGVTVINASVPPGEDGHVVHRTFSPDELTQRGIDAQASLGWSRRRALSYLRMTRKSLLDATDFLRHTGADNDAWETWRKELRDLPTTTVDPDDPSWPSPPEVISALDPWATLWSGS